MDRRVAAPKALRDAAQLEERLAHPTRLSASAGRRRAVRSPPAAPAMSPPAIASTSPSASRPALSGACSEMSVEAVRTVALPRTRKLSALPPLVELADSVGPKALNS